MTMVAMMEMTTMEVRTMPTTALMMWELERELVKLRTTEVKKTGKFVVPALTTTR